MPWRNNSDYYAFKDDEIKRHAPPASGVYGIFNLRHHIFIGSSANVQETLLHHLKHLNSRYKRFRPTGFVFEVVPAEWRELRMFELIFEYDPVMKPDKDIGFLQLWRSWFKPDARAFDSVTATTDEPGAEHFEPVLPKAQRRRVVAEPLSHRIKLTRIAIVLGLIALVIGAIRLVPGQQFIAAPIGRYVQFVKKTLVSVLRRNDAPEAMFANQETSREENPPQTAAARPVAKNIEANVPSDNEQIAVTTHKPTVTAPAVTGPAGVEAKLPAPPLPPTQPEISPHPVRAQTPMGWSVQALAATNQSEVQALIDRLKAKNYDAFAIQVALKGQTWFRVRVGDFGTYPEAEALQNILRSKEGLSDAFAVSNAR